MEVRLPVGVESLKKPQQFLEEECFDAEEFRGNLSLLKGFCSMGIGRNVYCQYDRKKLIPFLELQKDFCLTKKVACLH